MGIRETTERIREVRMGMTASKEGPYGGEMLVSILSMSLGREDGKPGDRPGCRRVDSTACNAQLRAAGMCAEK